MTVNIENNRRRPMLRNKNINYSRGTFFVTMQAAFNKTIFGAIVGEKWKLYMIYMFYMAKNEENQK